MASPISARNKGHAADDPEIHFPKDILGTMRKIKQDMIVILMNKPASPAAGVT